MNLQQQIPQVPDVEACVLATVMSLRDAMPNFGDQLSADLFHDLKNQIVCEAILAIADQGREIDLMSVSREIKLRKNEHIVSVYDISKLLDKAVFSLVGFEEKILILKEYAIRRKLIRDSQNILTKCYDESADVFDLVSEISTSTSERLDEFCKKPEVDSTSLYVSTVKTLSKNLKEMNDFRKGKTDQSVFVSSGLNDLDDIVGLFGNGRLYIIGARPAMGKSALVVSIAVNAAKRGKHGLIFSLEMSNREIMTRIISQEAQIQSSVINSLKINNDEFSKIMSAPIANSVSKLPLCFDDSAGASLSHVRARCQKLKRQGRLDFVIIDYLQLMQSPLGRNASTNDKIGELSKGLKNLAKDLEVPIIALSQLNRSVETRGDKRPTLSDLRDSGNVEQDADVVMLLWRPDYYGYGSEVKPIKTVKGEIYPQGLGFIDVAKQRDGITGIIPLKFVGQYTKFENYIPETQTVYSTDINPNQFIEPNKTFDDVPF